MDKETFKALLPDKPYCSDRKGKLIVRSVDSAIELPLIQYNSPGLHRWQVFDLDRRNAWEVIQESKLPKPNFTAVNRENGHAHFGYLLRTPVYLLGKSSMAPQRYAQAIERGFKRAVGADPAYSGFVGKNPVHPQWDVDWGGNYGYDLAELGDCLTKEEKKWIPEMENEGLGRNCTLFNSVRHTAYRSVLKYKKQGLDRGEFLQAITDLTWAGSLRQAQHAISCPLLLPAQ